MPLHFQIRCVCSKCNSCFRILNSESGCHIFSCRSCNASTSEFQTGIQCIFQNKRAVGARHQPLRNHIIIIFSFLYAIWRICPRRFMFCHTVISSTVISHSFFRFGVRFICTYCFPCCQKKAFCGYVSLFQLS